MKKWLGIVLVVSVMAGCGTIQYREPFSVKPTEPNVGEIVSVKKAVIVVDSSQSMNSKEKFSMAKSLTESFVSAMPEGDYLAGMVIFGNQNAQIFSLEPFNRSSMASIANEIPYFGGNTPLDYSLDQVRANLGDGLGKTAVIIFSDGRPTSPADALNGAKRLVDTYADELCIHTVQIGNDKKAGAYLAKISDLTSCGSSRTGESIDNPAAMKEFVRTVFFGPDKDSDEDGIYDTYDQCPNTPKGAKVDLRGCWVIPGLTFDLDRDVIKPEFYNLLDDVANVLKKNEGLRIRIDGHACDRGTEEHNQDLSERRAKAVLSYLVQKGIEETSLKTRGFGESKPIAPNTSEANRAKNRRVELTVIEE